MQVSVLHARTSGPGSTQSHHVYSSALSSSTQLSIRHLPSTLSAVPFSDGHCVVKAWVWLP